MATLILGRDGMGGASEADFDTWVAFVCTNIDRACGFEVGVETRAARDVQTDAILQADDAKVDIIREVKDALWDRWCSEGAQAHPYDPRCDCDACYAGNAQRLGALG